MSKYSFQDIIYWNKATGFSEPCTRSDMKFTKCFTAFNREYNTDRIAEKLILDNQASGFRITLSPSILNIAPLTAITNKVYNPSSIRINVTFKVIEKTEDKITVEEVETVSFDSDKTEEICNKVAKIDFIRKPLEVKGKTYKGGIVIYDVSDNCVGNPYTKAAIGFFALGVGLYYLIKLDGEWERLDSLNKDEYKTEQEKEEDWKALAQRYQKERDTYKKRIDDLAQRHNQVVKDLQGQIRMLKDIIAELRANSTSKPKKK